MVILGSLEHSIMDKNLIIIVIMQFFIPGGSRSTILMDLISIHWHQCCTLTMVLKNPQEAMTCEQRCFYQMLFYKQISKFLKFRFVYRSFCNQYVDQDAQIYLILANELLHGLNPNIITIAEDV